MALKICYVVGFLLVVAVWSRALGNNDDNRAENRATAVFVLRQLQTEAQQARTTSRREYLERLIEQQKKIIVQISDK